MQRESVLLFFSMKACGFLTNPLFFFLKEKEAKRIKKRAVLSLCHFVREPKVLAPIARLQSMKNL